MVVAPSFFLPLFPLWFSHTIAKVSSVFPHHCHFLLIYIQIQITKQLQSEIESNHICLSLPNHPVRRVDRRQSASPLRRCVLPHTCALIFFGSLMGDGGLAKCLLLAPSAHLIFSPHSLIFPVCCLLACFLVCTPTCTHTFFVTTTTTTHSPSPLRIFLFSPWSHALLVPYSSLCIQSGHPLLHETRITCMFFILVL